MSKDKSLKPVIAFIGTGIMGAPMAQHLLSAGYKLKAWNRSPEKTRQLSASGATVVTSCTEALRDIDVAICMLSTGPVIDEVLFGPDASGEVPVHTLKPGSILVVMSSIPVETSQRHAQYLSARNVRYVDAPVSGGEAGAKAGKLTIMAGGDKTAVETVRAVLETMGTVTHVGPSGMGQLTKLANQMIVGTTIAAVAEAFLLAKRGGADLSAVREALCGGFADSAILRAHGNRMLQENFAPGAPSVYQLKDLRTAQQFAEKSHLDLPVLSTVTRLYEEMCGTELRGLDHSALYLYLERSLSKQ